MKTKIIFCISIFILQFNFLYCQEPEVRHGKQLLEDESMSDPYLPNKWNNKKTSPAFSNMRIMEDDSLIISIRTVQVNIDGDGLNIIDDAANEPSLAINPDDTLKIAIGWRQFDNIGSSFRQAGWSYSSDGGITWSASVIDPGVFRSDPVLDYDRQNNFYYNSLTPYPDWECDIYKSEDGGENWDAGTYAYGGDKQWMTIDKTGGEGSGNIYAVWTADYSACTPGDFTRSTDGNASYESCENIPGQPFYGNLAINSEGYLFVAGGGISETLTIAKSENAKTPGADIIWSDPVDIDLKGELAGWASINPEGLLGMTNIEIDRSGGPGEGNIYVLSSVDPSSGPDQADVAFAKSTDGGTTWSDVIWINDEKGDGFTHWLGTMSIAPNGRIDVIWLDTRDGGGTDSSSLYYSYSLDQGETWSANTRLSNNFDPHVGYPSQNKMGDYFDMTSDDTGAHLAWANTFNGEEDVYYSRILLTEAEPEITTVEGNQIKNLPHVSPNPGNGEFLISGLSAETNIVLLNPVGQQLKSWIASSGNFSINITTIPAGLYLLEFINENDGVSTIQIIKN